MEQSLPNFAKEAFHNLKNSFFQHSQYRQLDEESENEEDHDNMQHSLFYSVHQQNNRVEDSIPLTLSNAYSDRSQLLFSQESSDNIELHASNGSFQEENYEESPVSFFFLDFSHTKHTDKNIIETICYLS
jgi:hypothetical protein